MRIISFIVAVGITGLWSCSKLSRVSPDLCNIPPVHHITLDANLQDWEGQGMPIPLFVDTEGLVDTIDFNARVNLGWNQEGLYIACHVCDDSPVLTRQRILQNDAIEIFVSLEPGTHKMVQYLMPLDQIYSDGTFRIEKNDTVSGGPLKEIEDFEVSTARSPEGYTFEAFIPYAVIPVDRAKAPAVQIIINDSDDNDGNDVQRYAWYYCYNTYINNFGLQPVRLVGEGRENREPPLHVTASLVDGKSYQLFIAADASYRGKKISVVYNGSELFQGRFVMTDEDAVMHVQLEADQIDPVSGILEIRLENRTVRTIHTGEVFYSFSDPTNIRSARFENEIRLYEYRNAMQPPSDSATLFLGSSSFRLWKTLPEDFPSQHVVLCGFGGSRTEDMLYFFDRIIKPFSYKKIVYFCGINDINGGVQGESIIRNVRTFVEGVRETLPGCQVVLLSNTVSVNRKQNYDRIMELNRSYRELAEDYRHVIYVDVSTPLLDHKGNIRPGIYSADSTHMNPEGYQIWTRTLKEYLYDETQTVPDSFPGRAFMFTPDRIYPELVCDSSYRHYI